MNCIGTGIKRRFQRLQLLPGIRKLDGNGRADVQGGGEGMQIQAVRQIGNGGEMIAFQMHFLHTCFLGHELNGIIF